MISSLSPLAGATRLSKVEGSNHDRDTEQAVPIATLVFVVSSVVAMGLGLFVSEIIAPLRNLVMVVAVAIVSLLVLLPLSRRLARTPS